MAASFYGAFIGVHWVGIGIQTVVDTELLSYVQLGIFCLVGSLATLLVGYVLCWQLLRFCKLGSKLVKAVCYYCTIVLLIVDPLYLAFLYKFVGGGDMNGIRLLGCPELMLQLLFLVVGLFNLSLICRYVYPQYRQALK